MSLTELKEFLFLFLQREVIVGNDQSIFKYPILENVFVFFCAIYPRKKVFVTYIEARQSKTD